MRANGDSGSAMGGPAMGGPAMGGPAMGGPAMGGPASGRHGRIPDRRSAERWRRALGVATSLGCRASYAGDVA